MKDGGELSLASALLRAGRAGRVVARPLVRTLSDHFRGVVPYRDVMKPQALHVGLCIWMTDPLRLGQIG